VTKTGAVYVEQFHNLARAIKDSFGAVKQSYDAILHTLDQKTARKMRRFLEAAAPSY
jgi:hypothetical protein